MSISLIAFYWTYEVFKRISSNHVILYLYLHLGRFTICWKWIFHHPNVTFGILVFSCNFSELWTPWNVYWFIYCVSLSVLHFREKNLKKSYNGLFIHCALKFWREPNYKNYWHQFLVAAPFSALPLKTKQTHIFEDTCNTSKIHDKFMVGTGMCRRIAERNNYCDLRELFKSKRTTIISWDILKYFESS